MRLEYSMGSRRQGFELVKVVWDLIIKDIYYMQEIGFFLRIVGCR